MTEYKENKEYKQGEIISLKHNFFMNYIEYIEEECDGNVYWDEGLDGFVCDKCDLYTGVK